VALVEANQFAVKLVELTIVAAVAVGAFGAPTAVMPLIAKIADLPPKEVLVNVILCKILLIKGESTIITLS